MIDAYLNRRAKNRKISLTPREIKNLRRIWAILWYSNWTEKEQLKVLARLLKVRVKK